MYVLNQLVSTCTTCVPLGCHFHARMRTAIYCCCYCLPVAVKKKLTRNELIENHSEKTQTIKDFKDKLDKSNRILDELKTDYTEIKCRYS